MLMKIVAAIESSHVPLSTEAEAQRELELVLARFAGAHGCVLDREVRLDTASRIDFVIACTDCGAFGIEAKVGSARRSEIRRQLDRYASTGRFAGLILASNRAMALGPMTSNGVPLAYASLGRGWL